MIYIYDVLVNLSESMYDFYDWEETDDFSHVRRVPMFKVSSQVLFDFATKKVRIGEDTKNNIKDKTQIFSSRNIEIIQYAAILTDGVNAFMIVFDDKGFVKKKSKFLVNEELEIIDTSKSIKLSELSYNVVSNKVKRNVMIRSEERILSNIVSELEKFKNDKEKIDYLYYEWFERQDGEDKFNILLKDLKSSFTDKHLDFLELLNLLTIKR